MNMNNDTNTDKQPTRRYVITVEVYDVPVQAQDERPPAQVVDWGQWLPNCANDTEPVASDAVEPAPQPQEPRGIVAQASRPTYATGRAQHPTGDDRADHTRYGTGRKTHRCSVCGAPNTRFNYSTGMCAGSRRYGVPCTSGSKRWRDLGGEDRADTRGV